ncbi:MAG: DUF4235 domain-containing protein [Solirubrobacteraceae bacterium]
MSALFTPFSVIVGLLSGQLAKRLFMFVWGKVKDEEPPSPKHREIVFAQLVVALVVEGAIARLVRGLVDHGTRHAWTRATGAWPGEERPEHE